MADMTMMDYLNDMGNALNELPSVARNTLLVNTLAKFNDHEQECGECDHQNGKPCTWADGMYTGFALASNMERLNEIAETDVEELIAQELNDG